ncbi:hypothetical protein LXL04_016079 [Taraxacum kok-saghyz]
MQSQIKKSKYPGFKKSTITVDYRFLQTPLLYAIFNIVTCSAIMFEPEARDSPSEIQKINTLLLSLLNDQAIRKQPIALQNASQVSSTVISQVDMMPQISVRDPLGPINTKGRTKVASRIKSCLEAPKKRTCSYCQRLGHYATSCPKRKAEESLQDEEG